MKNLIVAIGGTGGTTIRSLKYRLGLFNTLHNTNEEVQEIYIDALSLDLIESDKSDRNDKANDKSYGTLAKHDTYSYVLYKGGGITEIADLLELEASNRSFSESEAIQRHAYRWFHAHHYRKISGTGTLMKVEEGAGRYRQFGRMLIDRNYDAIAREFQKKIERMDKDFRVFMVFSVAGGTGAGAVFDTAMILRSVARQMQKVPVIYAFIVMGRAFNLEDPSPTYAALRELQRLGSIDGNATYTVNYRTDLSNSAVLRQEVFDTKFIVDFNQEIAGLDDDDLRYLGLYPSLADLIELMIQREASNYLYQAAANWPSDVQKARNVANNELFDGAAAGRQPAYKLLKKGLSEGNDWFVTYKTQRIFFPKDLYLDISRDQLIIRFLDRLFPLGKGTVSKDNISLKTGQEVDDDRALKGEENECCYRILRAWNDSFMGSVVSEKFATHEPFHERELNDRFDKYAADELVHSLFIPGTDESSITAITEKSIERDIRDSIVGDVEDLNTFDTALDLERERARADVETRLEQLDTINKNVIRQQMAQHALRMLNTAHKRGTLGFVRELFRFLGLEYLNKIDIKLGKRETAIKEEHGRLISECNEKSKEIRSPKMNRGTRRKAQRQLLELEQTQLELFRGLKANGKLIEYVKFAIEEAKHWQEVLKDWESNLTASSRACLRVDAEKSIEHSKRILKELAMSSGVSLGLPRHEFVAGQKGGRQARSFDTVKTDMGGFQKHVHELLQPESLVEEWVHDLSWAVEADIEQDPPTNHVIDPIVPILSLAGKRRVDGVVESAPPLLFADVPALNEQLDKLVREAAEGPIGGVNLFTYLIDWAPKQSRVSALQIADEVGKLFVGGKHYLECDGNPGLWHSYLAYDPQGGDVGDFIAEVSKHSIGPKESTPTPIPNYGDGNSLAFVHFAVGVTIEDAPSLRQPRDRYIAHIRHGRETKGKGGYDIGEVLSNHIFPEEQAMLRFEIEDLELADGRVFSAADFVPVELSPLFEDPDRLDLFARLYAADLVVCELNGNRHLFYYRRDTDLRTQVQPHNQFILTEDESLVNAARAFVANGRNVDAQSTFRNLPSLEEMSAYLDKCINEYHMTDDDLMTTIKEKYPEQVMWHDAVLVNLLYASIDDLGKLKGEELDRCFKVNYGTQRATVSKDRLREIMLHFFQKAMNRAVQQREEKRPKRRFQNRKII